MEEEAKEYSLEPHKAEPLNHDFNYRVCAPFHYHYKVNDRISEFDIDYYTDSDIKDLIVFVREYHDRMINICFKDSIDEEVLKTLVVMFDNFRVKLSIADLQYVKELNDNHIKWYFDMSYPATDFTMLKSIIDLGASAVYIGNDLAYNLDTVSQTCHDAGVQLRCVLNRVPATTVDAGKDVRSYVYDPRSMDELNGYYDCFEFDLGDTPIDWHKWRVLFRAFFEVRGWHGDLAEINEDLDYEYRPDQMMPDLPMYKANCGLRCLSRYSNHCNKCERIVGDMQRIFREKEIGFS